MKKLKLLIMFTMISSLGITSYAAKTENINVVVSDVPESVSDGTSASSYENAKTIEAPPESKTSETKEEKPETENTKQTETVSDAPANPEAEKVSGVVEINAESELARTEKTKQDTPEKEEVKIKDEPEPIAETKSEPETKTQTGPQVENKAEEETKEQKEEKTAEMPSQPETAAEQETKAAPEGPGGGASSSGKTIGPGASISSDESIRLNLDFTLIRPNTDYNGKKVAKGWVKNNGEWEKIDYSKYVCNAYFKLIRESNDYNNESWYVVAVNASKIGNFVTSDGNPVTELWLRKADCTAQNYIDINSSNETRTKIVKEALSHLGDKYRYSGNGPDEFDCSGFVHYVYDKAGLSVKRTSSELCEGGTQVSENELKAGDVLGRNGHVGIYLGDSIFIHASATATGVIAEYIEDYGHTFTNFVNYVD